MCVPENFYGKLSTTNVLAQGIVDRLCEEMAVNYLGLKVNSR